MNRRHAGGASLALVLVVAAVFWPTLGNEFIDLDDAARITENPHLEHLSLDTVRWAFSVEAQRLYVQQPLTWLSFALDYAVFGPDPAGFHAVSLALHALTAVLVLLLLYRLTAALAPSVAAAALFALHPLTVEPVAWASERNALLAAVFGLGAIHLYVTYARRPSLWRYLAVLGLFAASLLAKPWLFGVPAVLLALDFWPLRRWSGDAGAGAPSRLALVGEKLPFLVLGGAWALAAIRSMQESPAALSKVTAARPLLDRLSFAAVAGARYLAKIASPVDLAVHYPYPDRVPAWQIAGALALLLGVTAGALAARRRAPVLLVGWIWFLALIAPTLGIVQAGTWPAIADRFAYLAMVGPIFAVAFTIPALALARAGAARWALPAAAVVLVAALSVGTRVQLRYWHDTGSLLAHSAAVAPGSPLIEWTLGRYRARHGDLGEAEVLLRRAAPILDTSEAHNDLGNVFLLTGRQDDATREYELAVARDPGNAEALYNLARAREAEGRAAEARELFERFLRVAPASLDAVKRDVEAALASSRE